MLPDWDHCFPNCPLSVIAYGRRFPIAGCVSTAFPNRSGTPKNEAEYAEVLARHNRILGELTRPGGRVVLLTTGTRSRPSRGGRIRL